MAEAIKQLELRVKAEHVSEEVGKIDDEALEDLIGRAAAEPEALAVLYRGHYEGVVRYCQHRLFNRAAAEDVTGTVFMKMVEHLGRFRGGGRAFRGWLYRIATNEINNHLRDKMKRVRIEEELKERASDSEVGSEDEEEKGHKLVVLRKAIGDLKPRHQAVVTLRFFENMNANEIAEALGGSPGTVRSQLTRALAKLRKKIEVMI